MAPMRCPVMPYANQSGWLLLNHKKFTCLWNGSRGFNSVKFDVIEPHNNVNGGGVINFPVPYIFELEPGYELLVRGVPNLPKPGVFTLEALVDVNKAATLGGVHVLITQPNKRITFEANEPIAMIVPQKKGELELFDPSFHELKENEDKEYDYYKWIANRTKMAQKHHETGVDVRDFKGTFHKQMDMIKRKLKSFK